MFKIPKTIDRESSDFDLNPDLNRFHLYGLKSQASYCQVSLLFMEH